MIDTSIFPHQNFPYRLDFIDKKNNNTVCFFSCSEHMEKYISRYKLNKSELNIRFSGQTGTDCFKLPEKEKPKKSDKPIPKRKPIKTSKPRGKKSK